MAYVNSSPAKLVAKVSRAPAVAAPTVRMSPADIDRLKTPKALKRLELMRKLCLALPESDEVPQFGSPTWRVGKRSFAMLYDYGKGLHAGFWVGVERQWTLEMDPRFSIPAFLGHNGWIAFVVSGSVNERELRDYLIESYRHFATRRAIARLDHA
jgi:predicted DNA-binding protein (MmcQ/YjbR family)